METGNLRIGKDVFEKALRKKELSETVKVLEIRHWCFSEKGLNFLSDMFEASVKYTVSSKTRKEKWERSTKMVIKCEPFNEAALDMVRQQDLFLTELKVLRDVLPMASELLGTQIRPRLWHGCEDPRVLIMENLNIGGFAMKSRQKGLSLNHCCLVMDLLAKLHAGTVAVYEKEPELIEWFREGGIVSEKCPKAFLRLMEVSLLRISDSIETWQDPKCVSAAPKLRKVAGSIGTRCIDVYSYDPDEFCVLNHGDCWINNIMFKENGKGQPTDLVLVDYQMAVYTSPAIDLLYFLNICPEHALRYDKDDYLLEIYLDTLRETMQMIGCKTKPPTMEDLKNAMYKRRAYAIFAGLILYLRMMADAKDTEDFTEMLKKFDGETKMDVFKNPDAVRLAQKIIPVMDERGYFD